MATFHLQIVTPDRMVYDGLAERIILRTIHGDVAILARHINYAAPLGVGQARVTDENGNTRIGVCNSGLLSVENGVCRVLATTFEWAEEIDRDRAEAARQRAQEQLNRLQRSDAQFAIAEAKLKRAIARLNAAE